MKTSLLKSIRHPGEDRKRVRLNYKAVTFFICLLLAIALWLMNAFSKVYTAPVNFYISYQNLPKSRKLYPSANTMQLSIKGSGFRIMSYKLGISDPIIKIDANQFRHYYYSLGSHLHQEKIQDQLNDDIKLVDIISPDTLFLQDKPEQPSN